MTETSLCELRVQQPLENWVESVQIPGEAQPGAGISHETKPRPQGVGTACGQGTHGIVLLLKCSPGLWSTTPENLWPYPTLCRSLEESFAVTQSRSRWVQSPQEGWSGGAWCLFMVWSCTGHWGVTVLCSFQCISFHFCL